MQKLDFCAMKSQILKLYAHYTLVDIEPQDSSHLKHSLYITNVQKSTLFLNYHQKEWGINTSLTTSSYFKRLNELKEKYRNEIGNMKW